MLISAASYKDLDMILLAKKLYLTDKHLTPEAEISISRNFARGY